MASKTGDAVRLAYIGYLVILRVNRRGHHHLAQGLRPPNTNHLPDDERFSADIRQDLPGQAAGAHPGLDNRKD
jgi:hypothetical protein